MRVKQVVVLFLVIALFASCATLGAKPWTDRTPKEKASYFMAIYNRQFDDTVAMATSATLTDSQRSIVRQKKDILSKLWPLIQGYDTIAVHGGIPTFADEQAILDYINRLATLGG